MAKSSEAGDLIRSRDLTAQASQASS